MTVKTFIEKLQALPDEAKEMNIEISTFDNYNYQPVTDDIFNVMIFDEVDKVRIIGCSIAAAAFDCSNDMANSVINLGQTVDS